eukprot:EC723868.1.p3 GENE.EC723868.1~~EC723868.1.p3  ORF type:complete len:84 (+),score=4.25 EC723868.1:322-573(+)
MICGWGQASIDELVSEALKQNAERTELAKRESHKKALAYLEDEARYFKRFLAIYQRLSILEKIAIGRSHEVKNLSLEIIVLEV